MPATPRQIDANRKNALLSTGPRTEAGKAVSRGNGIKHGLSGEGIVSLPDDLVKKEERLKKWRPSYEADIERGGADGEFHFEQMVLNSLRIEEAQRREFDLHDAVKTRALSSWNDDRSALAESIGEKLAKAKNPGLVVARLRTFLQGIEWLMRRWTLLIQVLETERALTEDESALFDSLLGIPKMFRQEPDPDEDRSLILGLARDCFDELEQSLAGAQQVDEFEREAAILRGFTPEIPKAERLNRRYEDLAQRRYQAARKLLKNPDAKSAPLSQAPPIPQAPHAESSTVEPRSHTSVVRRETVAEEFQRRYPAEYLANEARRNEASGDLENLDRDFAIESRPNSQDPTSSRPKVA